MIATIELRELELYAYHGCFAEEQVVGNYFIVDADIEVDATRCAKTDNVADALNYVNVCTLIRSEMSKPQHLLESVAANIVAHMHEEFDAQGLCGGWIRIRKMSPPVGVKLASVAVRMSL